jgi:hypothetical protein
VNAEPVKESVVNKPAHNVTLSAEEGEALIARVHQSNLSAADAGVVEWVIRMYCWVAFTLQEAKLSVKRLRDVLFGPRRTPKRPPESEASLSSSATLGQGEGRGEPTSGAEVSSGCEAAGCEASPGASQGEVSPTPTGGHRQGTGRLGAEAYVGAERTECRHEE